MKKLFFIFLLSAAFSCQPVSAGIIYAISDKGLLVSKNNGSSWSADNGGLPAGTVPLNIYISGNMQYLTTRNSGIFRREGTKGSWTSISSDREFLTRSSFTDRGYRKISAFAVDKKDNQNIIMATKHNIYGSKDGGKNWSKIAMNGLGARNYITALELDGDEIYAGTSFNGFFTLTKKGFVTVNQGLPGEPYSGNLRFIEEFTSIAKYNNTLYAGFRFGGAVFAKNHNENKWNEIHRDENSRFSPACGIFLQNEKIRFTLGKKLFSQENGLNWREEEASNYIKKIPEGNVSLCAVLNDNETPLYFYINQKSPLKKDSVASNKRAIYSSVWAVSKKLDYYIKMMQKSSLNAIVIDMKDDFGNLYYPTSIKTAQEIGAAKQPISIEQILKRLHDNKIYVIARIVVFKDEKLFKGYGGKYAIQNSVNKSPWRGSEGEYWVDPHSKFVREYNISIASELEKLGFDEIQFDYIRFPSDGDISRCFYSFREDSSMYKSEILADFLLQAKENLSIPVAIDIYGFNSWYSFGNWIGQDMEEFSLIVDVISPMNYPSHFGDRFYMNGPRETRSYRIIYNGGIRASDISTGTALIRPYLQAFNMMSPTWGPSYIKNQAKAADDSGCDGFIFWNAAGDYSIVEKGLIEYNK